MADLQPPDSADDLRQSLTASGWRPEAVQSVVRAYELTQTLMQQAHPDWHPLQAGIVAGDMASAEAADARVAAGEDPTDLLWTVGSFSRLQWALTNVPRPWLLRHLPEVWRGSDPDDTDPAMLALWREAWLANDGVTVTDGPPLPTRRLRVWRGQMPGQPLGISWSLNHDVADAFARGSGARVPTAGVVYTGLLARPRLVMGYVTGRNEAEVVVDPADVAGVLVVTRYEIRRVPPRA